MVEGDALGGEGCCKARESRSHRLPACAGAELSCCKRTAALPKRKRTARCQSAPPCTHQQQQRRCGTPTRQPCRRTSAQRASPARTQPVKAPPPACTALFRVFSIRTKARTPCSAGRCAMTAKSGLNKGHVVTTRETNKQRPSRLKGVSTSAPDRPHTADLSLAPFLAATAA